VGTSTRLKPAAGNWSAATAALRKLPPAALAPTESYGGRDSPHGEENTVKEPDPQTAQVANEQLQAFWRDMRQDHDAFGLRQGMQQAASRLVDLIAPGSSATSGIAVFGRNLEEKADSFVEAFTRRVAGEGSRISDAIIRRAAVATARKAVRSEAVKRQLDLPDGQVSFTGELFCMIYKLFLGDVVATAIKTLIQEKIRLAVPILRLTDPVVNVSGWIAAKIVSIIPDPCAELRVREPGASLLKVGHDLVTPSVERALGLDGG
jgi:hypothetical protein